MIKQLTIICSSEIADRVTSALSKEKIQGFAHLNGTGTNVVKKGPYTHDLTWPADLYIVPGEEAPLRRIVDELKRYAGDCEVQPCLKLILSDVEEMY